MTDQTNYPGIFSRVKATIVDSIILVVLMLAMKDVFSMFEDVPNFAKIITFSSIFILYDPIMISLFGATFGHRLNKLKVKRLENDKKLNFGLAVIRFLIKATLGWLSLVTISSNENRQAIHDNVVKSVVIYDE